MFISYSSPDGNDRLVSAESGYTNYPSGFEFLDQDSGRRMTFSTVKDDKFVTYDNDFTYDTKQKRVKMQNYCKYILTDDYWISQ